MGGFFTDCDRRWASTLSSWKRHIYPKEFAQDFGSAICAGAILDHPLFYPRFPGFWRSTPPHTRPFRATGCTSRVVRAKETCQVRVLCSVWAKNQMFPGYHPKHRAIHAFTTVATAASLHAAPCAHMRAQMSASEPNLVAVHESCGRTCSEERAARHLTLYGAAGAARAPHAMPGGHLRGCARAAGTSPFCAR